MKKVGVAEQKSSVKFVQCFWKQARTLMTVSIMMRITKNTEDVGYFQMAWKHLLVGSLSFVCYINSLWGEFVFDDNEALLGNEDVNPSTSLAHVFKNDFWGRRIFSSISHKSYRPLTIISFRVNFWLAGGLHPHSFHLVNVCLHVAVSLLYLHTCTIICVCAREKHSLHDTVLTPMIAALLFAVHPIHTESVAGVVGRAELMSALCFFLALLCYMRACNTEFTLWNMLFWLMLSLLITVCALLFKEQGVTVVGVCVTFDILFKMKADPLDLLKFKQYSIRSGSWRRCFIRMVVIVSSMVVIFGLRLSTGFPTFKSIDNPASFAESILTRALSYNYIYTLNVWLLMNPWWLCFDWSMGCVPLLESLLDPRLIGVVMFLVMIVSLGAHCILANKGTTRRLASMALGIMVITFLPASNIFIGVGFVVAERVLYLPSAGYCLLVALGIVRVMRRSRKLVWTGVIFLLIMFVLRSVQRSLQWLTEEDLFTSGIAVCPHNAKVLYNIGKVKSDSGDVINGMRAYKEAIRLYPEYDQALNNLGNLLKEHGRKTEAEKLFHRALVANPSFAAARMNLGIVQAALKKGKEAEESYKTAIKHRHKYPDAYYNLGNLYIEAGRHNDAVEAFKSAISLKKDHVSAWSNMGLLYENLRMHDKAEEVMRNAIAEIPDCAQLYSSLGVFLGKQNRLEEGKELLKTAVSINPLSGNYYANLGVIYHLMKDYKNAEDSYALALKLEPDLALARENFNKLIFTKTKLTK